jgi:SAM-dependent methyltransferase
MLTIFSIPKPFKDPHIINIQTNAVKSWINLGSEVEVILLGDDFGVADFCRENNIQHIKDVKCNKFGTPMLDSAFDLVRRKAENQLIMFVNADIILTSDILKIIGFLPSDNFLVVGRRWDIDMPVLINYSDGEWEEKLNDDIKVRGTLHPPVGSDYFIFNKESFKDLPAFAVGRAGWDNWMIEAAAKRRMKIIDASPSIRVIHQNHDYGHKGDVGFKIEDKANQSLLGRRHNVFILANANYQLTDNGLRKKIFEAANWRRKFKDNFPKIALPVLDLFRKSLVVAVLVCRRLTKFINILSFYIGQDECKKLSDCVLLARLIERQPAGSDRNLEYPWMLENMMIKQGKILDVGSTASDLLYDFLPKEVELNSLDLNDKPIKNPGVKFTVGDIRKTIYPSDYFDIISCISTLEHIGVAGRYGSDDDPDGDIQAMEEMKRILAPDGIILLTVPYGIKDILPINKLYNKERFSRLFRDFSDRKVVYKKYFKKYGLWLTVDEEEAAKTDMIDDRWYAIAFVKLRK